MYEAYNLPSNLNFLNTKFLDTISYCWFSVDTKWFVEYYRVSDYLLQFILRNKIKLKVVIPKLLEERGVKYYSGYEILIIISWKKEEQTYVFDVCQNEDKFIFRRENTETPKDVIIKKSEL